MLLNCACRLDSITPPLAQSKAACDPRWSEIKANDKSPYRSGAAGRGLGDIYGRSVPDTKVEPQHRSRYMRAGEKMVKIASSPASRLGNEFSGLRSPIFTLAIPEDLRNALRNFPWSRNQNVSEKQNRLERQMMTGAPVVTKEANSRAVWLRSATLLSPEKFDNAPSNIVPGQKRRYGSSLPHHHGRQRRRPAVQERARLPEFCN